MIDHDKVRSILRDHPTLSVYGWGFECEEPFDGHGVSACLEFMSLCGRTKTWSAKPEKSSYHIKHLVEAWSYMQTKPESLYIGSGVVTLCAIYLQYPWHRSQGPNSYIGIRSRDWRKLPPYSKTWMTT